MKISVVIPVYNESESLITLNDEVMVALKSSGDYEIIYVDDGSHDGSAEILKVLSDQHPPVRVITLYRNYGKAAGLATGFAAAGGEAVITMDSDLQDDPAEIPAMVQLLTEGWDLVSGWKKRRNDPISKRWPSKVFNFIVRIMTGVKIHDFNCGLKAYRNEVVKSLEIYGGLHRYIPALVKYKGYKVTEKVVKHRARQFGKTKYGTARYFHGLMDLFTVLFMGRYFQRPLHFFGVIGLALFLAGLAVLGYLTVLWLGGEWIGNRPLFFLGILLSIVGIQIFSLGLLAEMFTQRRFKEKLLVKEDYRGKP